jgi:hypothetical protein
MTNDFVFPTWTLSDGDSAPQLAGHALRGNGLMEAAPKAALFEKTMLPHLDAAYNLARWLTRNEHDAEDIVQEAYLRAFRFFDGFRGGDGRSWLLAVVRNTALTWLRRGWPGGAGTVSAQRRGAVHSDARPGRPRGGAVRRL